MHVRIYICIYIYIYILSSSRKPSGRFLMVSVVDIIQRVLWFPSIFVYGFRRRRKRFCLMVSVVGFCYGFRRGRKTFNYGLRRRIFDGFCRRRRSQHFRTYRVIPRVLGF